jgi:hypothetical protein
MARPVPIFVMCWAAYSPEHEPMGISLPQGLIRFSHLPAAPMSAHTVHCHPPPRDQDPAECPPMLAFAMALASGVCRLRFAHADKCRFAVLSGGTIGP